jgi:hypothetical protein
VTRTENSCSYVCGGGLENADTWFVMCLYTVVKLDSVLKARKVISDFKSGSL